MSQDRILASQTVTTTTHHGITRTTDSAPGTAHVAAGPEASLPVKKPEEKLPKVFGVGLGRTGTNSLTEALCRLGYRTIHFPYGINEIVAHDAAVDSTVAVRYRELDRMFPGARFIYTVREREPWLKSFGHWWQHGPAGQHEPMVQEIILRVFGQLEYDDQVWWEAYQRHDAKIRAYFAARPNDLLVLDITRPGPHWNALSSFLFGRGYSGNDPFPHLHASHFSETHHGRPNLLLPDRAHGPGPQVPAAVQQPGEPLGLPRPQPLA